jgi:hypothetical protein
VDGRDFNALAHRGDDAGQLITDRRLDELDETQPMPDPNVSVDEVGGGQLFEDAAAEQASA